MHRHVILLLTLFAAVPYFSLACSCFGPNNFCETLAQNPTPDLIVRGFKTVDEAYGMRFKVVDVISGTETDDTLMIWGDNGILCRLYTAGFSQADTFILAIHNTNFNGNFFPGGANDSLERPGDYHISVCGRYALYYNEGFVYGNITPTDTVMEYEQFVASVGACNPTGVDDPKNDAANFAIYPNPSTGHVTLRLESPLQAKATARVLNLLGQEIETITFAGGSSIDKQHLNLNPGIYLIEFSDGTLRETQRLVIQ